ncbi:MAG TPA: type II toxin-antitoxin system VapC family toxin [Thermoanaerobaculia bacterium]|nr:type II toxin-antitoxin system VapC family toxin [Thermoanaerobaculia bacterium]
MILDSSAIVAILVEEPGAEELLSKLQATGPVGVGTPTLVESHLVLAGRLQTNPAPYLESFLLALDAVVLPFSDVHWYAAADAFLRFGKGRHPAALNFGDCMAYATAKIAAQPLLCVGNDFPRTDLELA